MTCNRKSPSGLTLRNFRLLDYRCYECTNQHQRYGEHGQFLRVRLSHLVGQFNGKLSSPSSCSICGEVTTGYAWVQFNRKWELAVLCNAHMNRESLAKVFVLTDCHLLQVSDVQSDIVATFTEHHGPISVTKPDFETLPAAGQNNPFEDSDTFPLPRV